MQFDCNMTRQNDHLVHIAINSYSYILFKKTGTHSITNSTVLHEIRREAESFGRGEEPG